MAPLPHKDQISPLERLLSLGFWACIATAFLLIFLLVFSNSANAQWSTDPAAPLAVCIAPNDQTSLRAFADGNGGWYAFWLDKRTDGLLGEVYGQHFDADGYAQWTANGKLLISVPDTGIKELAPVLLDNGNVLINYIYGPSVWQFSLHTMAFDAAGDPVWAEPTVLDEAGTTMLGFDQVTAIATAGGAYVGWYDNYFGGSNLVNLTRIDNDGTLPWGGERTIDLAYYGPFELHGDAADGVLVQWRTGNGAGAALQAMRVDPTGADLWPLNVQVSPENAGLSYAFHTVETGAGPQITVWRDINGDIMMARLDISGSLTFPTDTMPVCTYASYHDLPKLAMSDGTLYAAWADNRPPAANGDVYLQKFDADGAPLWTVDGLVGISISTNYTTPGLVASDSGAVIAMTDGNLDGYVALRIRDDGTPAWSALGTFCTFDFRPFYNERIEMPDGDGGVVSFWRNWAGDLHAARIVRTGVAAGTTSMGEARPAQHVMAYPNPAQDRITLQFPSGEVPLGVEVIDGLGAIHAAALQGGSISVGSLAPGAYTVRIRTRSAAYTARFIKE
ncbi:MAG: T9SS type A sorting domain-containing protein [Flavobacteriales bacterium]|nr:T9SS type A sorting domain-containing protein [Flavobacteriales bacterium]MBP9081263.1 T9SS type A sorting domain-containing protein [Flavobacteriales bacterium]